LKPRSLALTACLAAGALLAANAPKAPEAPAESTRATMQRVFAALTTLLPVALSRSGWDDTSKQPELRAALDALDGAATALQRHGSAEAESFLYLSQSLGADARSIQLRVDQGRYEAAAYLTQRLTETCVACHTRLPATSAEGFADRLLARVDAERLDPLARARLQTAARQFDAALASYEAQFARSRRPDLALEDAIPSYLGIALRVRRDAERAERGLGLLARRVDVSASLAQNLPGWRAAVSDLAPMLRAKPSLALAREVLARGRELREFPADGSDLVHAIVASSLVHRFLESHSPKGLERAEAFYLLGQTECFARRSFEMSDAEHYLEQAIRAAPHSPLAARAYAQLERELVLGYTGSSGENVPGDVAARLRELRALSRPTAAPESGT